MLHFPESCIQTSPCLRERSRNTHRAEDLMWALQLWFLSISTTCTPLFKKSQAFLSRAEVFTLLQATETTSSLLASITSLRHKNSGVVISYAVFCFIKKFD